MLDLLILGEPWPSLSFRGDMCWRPRGCRGKKMTWEYGIGGLISLILLGYLVYALLWPERF
jgi:K+-transporting ATPase KdpF subunit